jgi:class 3 adenylate cyclase
MANKQKGEVALGDYTLRYSINALCELEDASGMSAVQLAMSLSDEETFKIKSLRLMVWGGLIDNHEEITLKQAGDIISDFGAPKTMEAITKAFELAMPDAEDGEKSDEGKS